MPWKIVHCDFEKSQVIFRDPREPIHLVVASSTSGFTNHIFLGSDDWEECPIYLKLNWERLSVVRAEKFQERDYGILKSILASLGCEQEERNRAIGWMYTVIKTTEPDDNGYFYGNRERKVIPESTQWPRLLDDEDLLLALEEGAKIPEVRRAALREEFTRRFPDDGIFDD